MSHTIDPPLPTHTHSTALSEEKRRLDGKLATLEEDFEEEQAASEAAQEKTSKLQQQADQLTGEVSQLQGAISRAENAKSQLEKQVHIVVMECYSLERISEVHIYTCTCMTCVIIISWINGDKYNYGDYCVSS